ncbi:MAG TPA: hypothetical protein PLK10_13990, partial [Ottowia sp.]|nr:hypothetical protein [Ottowia sp.]
MHAIRPPQGGCRWGVVLAAAALVALSGCGGGSDKPGGAGTPTQPAPPAAPPTAPPATPAPTTPPSGSATYGNLQAASLGPGASLNGAVPFPADNAWNTDISTAPVDPNSDALIASIGLTRGLHPDFGAGLWEGAPIGIPYVVVGAGQPKVKITFTDYGDESDPGPYPVPPNAPIEGQRADGGAFGGDRHVLVIDRNANRLYELGNAVPQADGSWLASGGAVFHLDSNTVRPGGRAGWTSADAAGLPIFPGLARYDEAA